MEFKGYLAKFYDFSVFLLTFGRIVKIREKIVSLIPDKKIKVLDFACGTGSQLIDIKRNKNKIDCYGVDISQDMINIAERKSKKYEINFSRQDFTKTFFSSGYFDIVIASLAFHEVDKKERFKAIKEIKRIISPNGKLIVLDFCEQKKSLSRFLQKIFFYFIEPFAEEFLENRKKLFSSFELKSMEKINFFLCLEKMNLKSP